MGTPWGTPDWGLDKWIEGGDPFDPGQEFSQDPVLGLPKTPYQAAEIDPAQDPFQFPFQYPSQNPNQGDPQYSPVDLPENQKQETFDPFEAWNDLNDEGTSAADRFDPHKSLVANAYEIGKSMAEEAGFDLGVFGEVNLGDSLLGNAWDISKRMNETPETSWDWMGDFPSIFEGVGNKIGEAMGDFAGNTEAVVPEAIESQSGMDALNEFASQIFGGQQNVATEPAIGAATEIASSPVVTQVAEVEATGIDIAAPEVVSGAAPALVGADVLPSAGELIAALGLGI